MRRFLNISTEDDKDGLTVVEKEHIIWMRLGRWDNKGFTHCEKQEQVSLNVEKEEGNFVAGSIRIRKTTDRDDNTSYELTIKQRHQGTEGKTETTLPATEDAYVQLCGLAVEKVSKHRYFYPIEGSDKVWEVDWAPNGKGGYHQWVRVEIEVDDLNAPIPVLPMPADEIILPPPFGTLSKEEWAVKNDELFKTYFVTRGPLVGYVNGTGAEEKTDGQEPTVGDDSEQEED